MHVQSVLFMDLIISVIFPWGIFAHLICNINATIDLLVMLVLDQSLPLLYQECPKQTLILRHIVWREIWHWLCVCN